MPLGYFGNIIFETSDERINTFSDFNRSSSARIEEHKLIGQKPLIEYCAPELEKITFSVSLNANNGINPTEELEKWRDYNLKGSAQVLVIGGSVLGCDKFIVESLSEAFNTIYKNGFLFSAKVDVSLAEYITDPKLQPQTKNTDNKILNTQSESYYQGTAQDLNEYKQVREAFNNYVLPPTEAINALLSLVII